jgi:hypothetical protein
MIMIDRSRRLSEPLRWGRREKIAVWAVAACLVLGLVGLGIVTLAGDSHTRRDCIDVTFASTLGASRLHACGGQARRICASPAQYRQIAEDLRAACAHAGFRVGSAR